VPTGPLVGSKQQMSGGVGVTVNESMPVPVPNRVVTEIGPLVAWGGTKATISVEEKTSKSRTAVPLKATLVAPVKPVPVIVTHASSCPLVGENELIDGGVVSPRSSTTTSSKFAVMPQ